MSDIMPTLLDLAGVSHPGDTFAGHAVAPMTGVSLKPLLDGTAPWTRAADEVVADELMGKRFVSEGALKALWLPMPHGRARWQLYDLTADPSERIDLAGERPQDLARLRAHWDDYARRNHVILPNWVSGY